jgi:hypothetical protein
LVCVCRRDRFRRFQEGIRIVSKIYVVLISTYELGRQPFGLASPTAWLQDAGASVTCLDLAVQDLDERSIAAADLVAFYVPILFQEETS